MTITHKSPGKHYRKGISLIDLFNMFPDEETAEKWFEEERWGVNGGELSCPKCGCSDKCNSTRNRKPMPYWCGSCRRHFSVRTGTVMARSRIPLQKWVIAIYLHTTSLKGVSSMKLHRDLDLTQKTTWHMLHRIRAAFGEVDFKFDGEVEVDETYVGGLEKNKHWDKKLNAGRGGVGKTTVVGAKERDTKKVKAKVIEDTKRQTLHGFIDETTEQGSTVYTDDLKSYEKLNDYKHQSVKHSVGEYVKKQAHINGTESFWAMLKRAHKGTYHKMSKKHLGRYVQEFTGRHNIREQDTINQMQHVAAGMVGKQLMYSDLISRADVRLH